MKLVDLKMTRAEREKQYEPAKSSEDAPVYPWGLSVHLDNETIEKLGTANVPMEVGSTISFTARARVTSCEDRQTEGDKHRRSVSLQIEAIGFEEKKGDAAGALYNGDKAGS